MEAYTGDRRPPGRYDDGDVRQLELDRNNNDRKLKARFEHIFRKYEYDFTGVGDEIDLETGDIVVNNGHLQHMRHEVDPGRSASSRFVRTFQEKLELEEESVTSEESTSSDGYDDEEESLEEGEDEESEESSYERIPAGRTHANALRDNTVQTPRKFFASLTRPPPRLARILVDEGTPARPIDLTAELADDDDTTSVDSRSVTSTPSANLLHRVPGLRESVGSLNTVQKRGGVDESTIQALGVTIANQLAQLMAGPGKTKPKQDKRKSKSSKPRRRVEATSRDPVWAYPDIRPASARHKRRRSPSPVIDFPSSPRATHSPGEDSLWAAEGSVRPRKSRRTTNRDMGPASTPIQAVTRRQFMHSSGGRSARDDMRRCWNCGLTGTTNWLKGPHDQDLCFSCGTYFERHRRMKPFDSPTPSVEDNEIDEIEQPIRPIECQESVMEDTHENMETTIPQDHQEFELKVEEEEPEQVVNRSTVPPTTGHQPAAVPEPTDDHSSNRQDETLQASEQTPAPQRPPPTHQAPPVVTPSVLPTHPPDHQQPVIATPNTLPMQQPTHQSQPVLTPSILPAPPPVTYTANTSRQLSDSVTSALKWTIKEDALLIKLKEVEKLSWERIQSHFPGRTHFAIQTRYNSYLRRGSSRGRDFLRQHGEEVSSAYAEPEPWTDAEPGDADDRMLNIRDRFSAEEDALIVRLKEVEGLTWNSIAKRYRTRTILSIQKRYSSFLAPNKRKITAAPRYSAVKGTMEDRILAVDPELSSEGNNQQFDPAEDAQIKELYEQQHLGWDAIAARMPGRSPTVVQHRYEYKFTATPTVPSKPAFKEEVDGDFVPVRGQIDGYGNSSGIFRIVGYGSSRASGASTPGPPLRPYRFAAPIAQMTAPQTPTPKPELINSALPASKATAPFTAPAPSKLVPKAIKPLKKGPGARRPFTEVDDALLLQLKETDSLSWQDIALRLPGRSIRSMTARYEDLLCRPKQVADSVPKKAGPSASASTSSTPSTHTEPRYPRRTCLNTPLETTTPKLRNRIDFTTSASDDSAPVTLPNSSTVSEEASIAFEPVNQLTFQFSSNTPYKPEEDRLLIQLRKQGLSWAEIAKQFPERNANNLAARYQKVRKSTRHSLPTTSYFAPRKNGNVLLRKALDNSLRRRSDQSWQAGVNAFAAESSAVDEIEQPDVEVDAADASEVSTQLLQEWQYSQAGSASTGAKKDTATESLLGEDESYSYADDGAHASDFDPASARTSGTAPSTKESMEVPRPHHTEAPVASPRRTRSAIVKRNINSEVTLELPTEHSHSDDASDNLRLSSPEPPQLTFSQLVRVAFEANAAQPMVCKDIYQWVEQNYEFYRLSPPSWKARVRAELSANPSFVRSTKSDGNVVWRLVDSGIPDPTWGLTRGPRRKPGLPPVGTDHEDISPTPEGNAVQSGDADMATSKSDMAGAQRPRPARAAQEDGASPRRNSLSQNDESKRVHSKPRGDSASKAAKSGRAADHRQKMSTPKAVRISDVVLEILDSDPDDDDMDDDELLLSTSPPIKHTSSDVNRDPESSPNQAINVDPISPSDSANRDTPAPSSSSSPLFVRPYTPTSAYGKLRTPRSAALRRLKQEARPATPVFVARSSTPEVASRVGIIRAAGTPVREVDSDEDELA